MATINCYGTLGSIAGPMSHCPPPPPCDRYYCQNFPFYSGPCPPGPKPQCCCPCCRPCPPPFRPEYKPEPALTNRCAALMTCGVPQHISVENAVPLETQLINPEFFSAGENGVVIHRAGLYMAIFCVNLPPRQSICTTFSLRLNGEPVEASRIRCSCESMNGNSGHTGQALIQAVPNSLLTLNAEEEFTIDVPESVDNVFSLSLFRIG